MPPRKSYTGGTPPPPARNDADNIGLEQCHDGIPTDEDARIAEIKRQLEADVGGSPKLKRWQHELQKADAEKAKDRDALAKFRAGVGWWTRPPTPVRPAAAAPAPSADAPPTSAPTSPKKVMSEAAVEQRFRDIVAERPNDPLNERGMLDALEKRLGAPPGRQRVRNMWKRIAPQWKRPRGHPHNKKSAD